MVDRREGDCLDFIFQCTGGVMDKIELLICPSSSVVKCHIRTVLEQSHFGRMRFVILTSNNDAF